MRETLDITERDLEGLFERYRRSPESRVFVMLADACRKTDRIEEALEICEQGLGRHPEYASGYVVKGKCLYDLERHEDAQRAFVTVLDSDADNLVALKYLGMMEALAGRFDSARRYLKQILRLDPENPEIMAALKHVDEQRQGDPRQSKRGAVERRQVDDEVAAEKPAASKEPETVVEDDIEVSDELATITLADIYASQGYKDKALKIYEEVLTRQPHNETIKRKIAGLAGDPSRTGAPDAEQEPSIAIDADDDKSERAARKTDFERVTNEGADEDAEAADEALPGPVLSGQAKWAPGQDVETRAAHARAEKPQKIDEGQNIDHFKQWLEGLRK